VVIPPEYERAASVVEKIAAAFATTPDPPCRVTTTCCGRTSSAMVSGSGSRLGVCRDERSGVDLGNLAVNNELAPDAEEHLAAAYHGRATARTLARLRLMKIVSDTREAMWGWSARRSADRLD